MKKITTIDFINKSKQVHGDKYDYSLSEYVTYGSKVKIICPIHGMFEQRPGAHSEGQGCKKCATTIISNKKNIGIDKFIVNARKVHGDLYDYSLVHYINATTKVEIVCPKHGSFHILPYNHVSGKNGCPKCVNVMKMDRDDIIEELNDIHNNKYDYSQLEIIDYSHKTNIICPLHGVFEQTIYVHRKGSGCPHCKSSKGELKIKEWLELNGIVYEQQKRFVDCRNVLPLPFDFYLPNHNTCIEYDGEQHFMPKYHGDLQITQLHDSIKTEYCANKNMVLIRIPYLDFNNIFNILQHSFGYN